MFIVENIFLQQTLAGGLASNDSPSSDSNSDEVDVWAGTCHIALSGHDICGVLSITNYRKCEVNSVGHCCIY